MRNLIIAMLSVLLVFQPISRAQTTQPKQIRSGEYDIEISDVPNTSGDEGAERMRRLLQGFLNRRDVMEFIAAQLNIPTGSVGEVAGMDVSDQFGKATLAVNLESLPPGTISADQLLDQLVEMLKMTLIHTQTKSSDRARQQVDELQARSQAHRTELADLQKKIRAITGRGDVSETAMNSEMNDIDKALRQLDIDVAAKQARVVALQEGIAKLTKQVDEQLAGDPVLLELKKIVDLKQERLEQLKAQVSSGTAPAVDAAKVAEEVAEARARMLERKTSATGPSIDLLGSWNRELLTLSIDSVEASARQKALRERQKTLIDASDFLSAVSQTQEKIIENDAALTTARNEMMQNKESETAEPEVTILRRTLK